MLKINSDLFSRIKDRFNSNKNAYARIKLEISKIFFGLMSSIYFFLYLSTVAGFEVELVSKLLIVIYPIFVFSIFVLLYDLCIYWTNIYYSEKVNTIKIPILFILTVIYTWLIAIFLGLKLN